MMETPRLEKQQIYLRSSINKKAGYFVYLGYTRKSYNPVVL